MDASSNYAAQSQTAYDRGAAVAQPRKPSELSDIATRGSNLNSSYAESLNRFEGILDRLAGSRPAEVTATPTQAIAGNLLAGLRSNSDGHAAMNDRLLALLNRLESIA